MVATYSRTKPGKLPPEVNLQRVCDAIARDRRELEPFRKNRLEMVRQYGGFRYGNDAAAAEIPVNLLGLYVEVITQSLIDQTPRLMYSTFDANQTAVVDAMQEWANEELVRMHIVETYKRIVYDALFCVDIAKIGLATPVDAESSAWDVKAGEPFIEAIDLDDFTCDMTARRFDRCSYQACRYRLPVSLANELYAKGRQDEFHESDNSDVNYGGDERIHTLSGTRGYREEIEPHCDLWEVFLPRHKLVVTLRDSGGIPDSSHKPVRVQPWIGPVSGPYHFLAFGIMPGNLMPKAPVMDLFDLHRHYNRTYRKLMERTGRAKSVTVYDSADTDDAKKIRDALDGEMVPVRNPDRITTIETGGPTNDLIVMSDHIRSMFNFRGGNLELLGGRAAQSRTATQDKILAENAGAGIGSLQAGTRAFVQECAESLNWFWWHHPTKEMVSRWAPQSLPRMGITRVVSPADRFGPMPTIKVDPYSLAPQTPQTRLGFIMEVLKALSPMMGMLAQQGKMPDMDEILRILAKYGNEPDLPNIFGLTVRQDPGNAGSGGSERPGMPAETTRTYERTSSGGQQAEEAQLNTDVSRMEGPANPNRGGME